jgi:hypothetical protein
VVCRHPSRQCGYKTMCGRCPFPCQKS